jgi:hypothetical protein
LIRLIAQAAIKAQGSVAASASIAASFNANLLQIVTAVQTAKIAISGATAGTAGALATGALKLTQQDVNLLIYDIKLAQALILGISASLKVSTTNLIPGMPFV